jgi:hypothetical protein
LAEVLVEPGKAKPLIKRCHPLVEAAAGVCHTAEKHEQTMTLTGLCATRHGDAGVTHTVRGFIHPAASDNHLACVGLLMPSTFMR